MVSIRLLLMQRSLWLQIVVDGVLWLGIMKEPILKEEGVVTPLVCGDPRCSVYSRESSCKLAMGMPRIILETDAIESKIALTTTDLDRSIDGSLFKQIRDFISSSFDECSVRHCLRSCNKVAGCLAQYGASMVSSGSAVLMSQVPTFVHDLVSSDLPRV